MQPGRKGKTEFPENLFNTWMDYRSAQGHSRADIIREINIKLGRKYDNDRVYKWKHQKLPVPSSIIQNFIFTELVDVLK